MASGFKFSCRASDLNSNGRFVMQTIIMQVQHCCNAASVERSPPPTPDVLRRCNEPTRCATSGWKPTREVGAMASSDQRSAISRFDSPQLSSHVKPHAGTLLQVADHAEQVSCLRVTSRAEHADQALGRRVGG